MFNTNGRLQVIGRITQKTYVYAYVCVDRQTGKRFVVDKKKFEELALNKQVYNCTAQLYNGIVNLKGIECKLNQLPRYTDDGLGVIEKEEQKQKVVPDLVIVGKIQKGKAVLYYVVSKLNDNSQKIKIARQQVMELARAGRIVNAKCQTNGNSELLRGSNGCNLTEIATYQL